MYIWDGSLYTSSDHRLNFAIFKDVFFFSVLSKEIQEEFASGVREATRGDKMYQYRSTLPKGQNFLLLSRILNNLGSVLLFAFSLYDLQF